LSKKQTPQFDFSETEAMGKQLLLASLMTAAMAMGSSTAVADLVIFSADYDTTSPSADSHSFGSGGNGGSAANVVDANGVGGSLGAGVTFEMSTLDNTGNPFTSVRYQADFGTFANQPTSSNPSDYEVSFDVRFDGLLSGQSTYNQFDIVIDSFTFRVEGGGPGDTGAAFTSFTYNLGDDMIMMPQPGSGPFDVSEFSADEPEFKFTVFGLQGRFGTDADNALRFDNISLSQISAVPEASSFTAFLLIGLATGGVREWKQRHRRNRQS